MYQYTLFQTDPTTIADDTQYGDGVGLYDMYFCRGKIQSSGTTSSFMINKEIANLKSAYYYERSDGSVYLVGGAYIEIGEERRLIETYDYKTGNVRLKSGFTTAPARGTVFRILQITLWISRIMLNAVKIHSAILLYQSLLKQQIQLSVRQVIYIQTMSG